MTLTVDIRFTHDSTLADIFAICQKVVNTPEGVHPIVKYDRISNPPGVGADCWMECSRVNGGFQVSLDIPYASAQKMHGIASRILGSLSVSNFQAYNDFDDTWHTNLDFLGE